MFPAVDDYIRAGVRRFDACPPLRYNGYAMPRLPKIYVGTILIGALMIGGFVAALVSGVALGPTFYL